MPVRIGLDFGTTNCAVGRITAAGTESVLGPWPSVIAFQGDRFTYGEEAKELIASGDTSLRVIRDIKLLLDTPTPHEPLAGVGRTPVDLAAGLLAHVKEGLVGKQAVDSAVVGTPVRILRDQRVAFREAARSAGIGEVRFVYEPTAALIGAEDISLVGERSNVLVVDWGGGTLDVAVVRHQEGLFAELSVDGDVSDLGGTCIDEELTRRVLNQYQPARRAVDRVRDGWARMKEEVELAKISILQASEEDGQAWPIVPQWLDEDVALHPRLVYRTVREFAVKARARILALLARSGMEADDITHLLFTGGVCQCAAVIEEIREGFPDAVVLSNHEPQLGTGRGCTRLTGQPFSLELGADLAVRECDDAVCVLLRRGQPIQESTVVSADFWVTDVQASEALFDFGIVQHNRQGAGVTSATSFRSLDKMMLALGRPATRKERRGPDLVKLQVGLDNNLVVAAYGVSAEANAQEQVFLRGVPLWIRTGRRP